MLGQFSQNLAKKVGAGRVLVVKRRGTGLATALAEKDNPPVVSPIQHMRKLKVRAIEPVARWRNVEVVKDPREPAKIDRGII